MKPQHRIAGLLIGASALAASPLAGQTGDPPEAPSRPPRGAWLSDHRPVQVGDLLAVVVDERTSASELTGMAGSTTRSQSASFGGGVGGGASIGPYDATFGTGMDRASRERGERERRGGLTGALTVRVVAIEPNGVVRVEGGRRVIVDGRPQELRLTGLIRTSDIGAANVVQSSRIADAEISYQGRKIGPSSGILGKLLGIFWP